MSSLQNLHRNWETLRSSLVPLIEQSDAGHVIYADSQFATAAWHNLLVAWRTELNDLMAQYPLPTQSLAQRSTTQASRRLLRIAANLMRIKPPGRPV